MSNQDKPEPDFAGIAKIKGGMTYEKAMALAGVHPGTSERTLARTMDQQNANQDSQDEPVLPSEAFDRGYVPTFQTPLEPANTHQRREIELVLRQSSAKFDSSADRANTVTTLMQAINAHTQKAVTEARIDEANNLLIGSLDYEDFVRRVTDRIAELTEGKK